MRKGIIGIAAVIAGCTQLGGSTETYQHILALLCNAPPNIMQNVLVTPELKTAWTFICGHIQSVPPTPVVAQVASPVDLKP